MNLLVRPFAPEDYPAAVDIHNAQNEPDHRTTIEQMRRRDARYDPGSGRVFARLSALLDSEIVGVGSYMHRHDNYAPEKFWVSFHVREDYQNRGVDTAMYDAMLELLWDHEPRSLWTCIREDFVTAAGYLGDRAFVEQFRSWGAHLELATFDPSPFEEHEVRLRDKGVEVRTLASLAADAERDRKLLALHAEIEEDAPHFEPIIPKAQPDFRDPDVLTDATHVAVHGDEYVGMAGLESRGSEEVAACALTGVKRGYRNQGIATALKARTASWAKAQGYADLNAGGAGSNGAMLSVNRRLGFDIEPAWLTFAKTLR